MTIHSNTTAATMTTSHRQAIRKPRTWEQIFAARHRSRPNALLVGLYADKGRKVSNTNPVYIARVRRTVKGKVA